MHTLCIHHTHIYKHAYIHSHAHTCVRHTPYVQTCMYIGVSSSLRISSPRSLVTSYMMINTEKKERHYQNLLKNPSGLFHFASFFTWHHEYIRIYFRVRSIAHNRSLNLAKKRRIGGRLKETEWSHFLYHKTRTEEI